MSNKIRQNDMYFIITDIYELEVIVVTWHLYYF